MVCGEFIIPYFEVTSLFLLVHIILTHTNYNHNNTIMMYSPFLSDPNADANTNEATQTK